MTDLDFLLEAYKEAEKALNLDEVPVGAVIVHNNKIIARAHNLKETSNIATRHAEIVAIEKASKKIKQWNLNNCSLYVTLEPCSMCTGAIINSRIQKVIFGARDFKTGALGGLHNILNISGFNHYPEILFLENELCSKILKDFFKTKRNKKAVF